MTIDDLIAHIESGVPVERLERRMRPWLGRRTGYRRTDYSENVLGHDGWNDFSGLGFLGKDESLISTIVQDAKTVEEHGTSHEEIAFSLRQLMRGEQNTARGYVYVGGDRYEHFFEALLYLRGHFLHNRRWMLTSEGSQSCPWMCTSNGELLRRLPHDDELRQNDDPFNPADDAVVVKWPTQSYTSYHGTLGIILKREVFSDGALEKFMSYFFKPEGSSFLSYVPFTEESAREGAKIYKVAAAGMRRYLKQEGPIHVPVTGILPHLIGKHYFFEGKRGAYRADPGFIIEALGLSRKVL